MNRPRPHVFATSLFLLAALAAGAGVACSKPEASTPTIVDTEPSAHVEPAAKKEDFGNVMAQVARRFELIGKAARSERYEFMAFEIGELEELFENDLPNADLPKEGPTAQISALLLTFRKTNLTALEDAAKSRDPKAVADAFAGAATACNGCHQASAKAFITISTVTGKSVPDLDPIASTVPSATPSPGTHAADPFGARR